MEKIENLNQGSIVNKSARLMRKLSAHYLSHLDDSPIEINQSWDMLKNSAEVYLRCLSTFNPLILDWTQYTYDIKRAETILKNKS